MTTLDQFSGRIWLHRRQRATWMFEKDKDGIFVHVTNKGTAYVIMMGFDAGKPFWVGRIQGDAAFTDEHRLRAHSLEFENAGEYLFPK